MPRGGKLTATANDDSRPVHEKKADYEMTQKVKRMVPVHPPTIPSHARTGVE